MLILVTPETVIVEATMAYKVKLARALRVPPSMVTIEWRNEGGIKPSVSVELPPDVPPSTVDVNDPEQMSAWAAEVGEMPGLRDFLKARGIDDPDKIINLYVQVMMDEVRLRVTSAQESLR